LSGYPQQREEEEEAQPKIQDEHDELLDPLIIEGLGNLRA
jgi:hypothetical protein